MSELNQMSTPPIAPVYGQARLNDPIDFGKVMVQCEINGTSHQGEGTASLHFAPKCRLHFTCPSSDQSPLAVLRALFENDGTTQIKLVDRNVSFEGFCSSTRGGEIVLAPTQSAVVVTPPSTDISRAVFHLFNFPDFAGPDDYVLTTGEPPRQGFHRCGRAVLKADGWTVTIAATDSTNELVKALGKEGGYAVTHLGEIKRDDNSQFSSEQLETLLTCLQYFLSFAIGRWAGVSLPVGFDSSGNRVYERWGMPISADGAWNSSCSWFDAHHGELLAQAFPGFLARWTDNQWREPLTHALYWYLGASDRRVGIGVDTGLILAQTALEGLAWYYCIQDRKMVSASAFAERGGINAANKLRLLATSMGIPTAIPSSLKALGVRKGKKWEDGMEAITCIRNALVHADAKTPVTNEAYYEAWMFSLWFIDLVVLRLSGHVGKYANRMNRRFVGKVESVPWA